MLDFKDMGDGKETPMHDLDCFFNKAQGKALPTEMVALAEKYDEEKQSIKIAENKIKVRKEALAKEEATLFDILVGLEVESFSSKGRTYYTRIDSYASVDASQKDAAFGWIRGEGFGDIIKLTVNAKSLTSVLKEVFEVTGAVPGENDGIKIRTVNRVGVRKK